LQQKREGKNRIKKVRLIFSYLQFSRYFCGNQVFYGIFWIKTYSLILHLQILGFSYHTPHANT
jgi:hypothetical protein